MKSPRRTAAALSAVAVLLLALTWGGGILFWHLRIRAALERVERTSVPGGTTAQDEENLRAWESLKDAGCRSLPYLVRALESGKPIQFLQTSTQIIAGHSNAPEVDVITSVDSEPERRLKCDRIREWWRRNGNDVHQFWRFWSDRCRPFERDEP